MEKERRRICPALGQKEKRKGTFIPGQEVGKSLARYYRRSEKGRTHAHPAQDVPFRESE